MHAYNTSYSNLPEPRFLRPSWSNYLLLQYAHSERIRTKQGPILRLAMDSQCIHYRPLTEFSAKCHSSLETSDGGTNRSSLLEGGDVCNSAKVRYTVVCLMWDAMVI